MTEEIINVNVGEILEIKVNSYISGGWLNSVIMHGEKSCLMLSGSHFPSGQNPDNDDYGAIIEVFTFSTIVVGEQTLLFTRRPAWEPNNSAQVFKIIKVNVNERR